MCIRDRLEEGIELGYDTYTVPFGTDTISAIYALGFAVRSALTFGGLKGGMARDILLTTKTASLHSCWRWVKSTT